MTENQLFTFKQFQINQSDCPMKVGTDGILLGAWCDVTGSQSVLDIGTGTGLIALMIAQRTVESNIIGVEIDTASCAQAKSNFSLSPWQNRLSTYEGTIQDFANNRSDHFDHIVCNPPFFSGGTLSSNQDKNKVRHTIKLSHQDLLRSTRSLLSNNGKFSVILPYIEGLRFIELAETYGFNCIRKTEVRSKEKSPVERLLLQFSRTDAPTDENQLVIYQEKGNEYSDQYISLTKDFYLNM